MLLNVVDGASGTGSGSEIKPSWRTSNIQKYTTRIELMFLKYKPRASVTGVLGKLVDKEEREKFKFWDD
jgi:hypothetical protein